METFIPVRENWMPKSIVLLTDSGSSIGSLLSVLLNLTTAGHFTE